jgi:biotin synthase
MGMEVCCTLGMIEKQQAEQLKKAGLTAYNHNLDTSREYYPNIITTRTYDERLQTLEYVREAGINVCSGNYCFSCFLFINLVIRCPSEE